MEHATMKRSVSVVISRLSILSLAIFTPPFEIMIVRCFPYHFVYHMVKVERSNNVIPGLAEG
jgi:hypothetical protein